MPVAWRVILAVLLAQADSASGPDPRTLLRQALLAVEGDSAPVFVRPWSRTLARDAADRMALLASGSVARLTYDYPRSDSLLGRLTSRGGDDALADYAWMEMGASLSARGRFREGAEAYGRAVAGAERRGDSLALADALLGLTTPRARLSAPAEVYELLDRAAGLGRGDPVIASGVACQRAALWSRQRNPGARPLADSGAAIARRAGDLRQEARCLHVVAQTYVASGDMGNGAEALGRSAALLRRARDRASLAAVLQWHGYINLTVGHFGTSRDLLTAAVSEGERSHAMSAVGWALINLGQISLGIGDRYAAARDLNRASALLEAQGDEWGMMTALGILGGLARAAGDITAATAVYQKSLAWAVRTRNVSTESSARNGLASLAIQTGNWAAAKGQLDSARALARMHRMTFWEGSLHYPAAILALRQGDLVTAEQELRTYHAVTDTSQRDIRYRIRALLAEIHVRRGEIDQAEAQLVSASRELDDWRALLPDNDLRIRAFQHVDYGADPDLGIATVIAALARAGRVTAAFELTERRRARDLTDRLYRAEAVRAAGPSAEERRRFFGVGPEGAASMDDSTALLEYVTGRGGEPTTLLVVTRAGFSAVALAPIDSLDADARRFVTLIESGGDARTLGARLGAALLEPAVAGLDPAITQLIIVPDDLLARLPFDALVLADGRYVIERFAVGFAPSAAAVAALRARARASGPARLLVFADPQFGRAGADPGTDAGTAIYRSAFDDAGGLGRLPASAREARRIARYAPRSEVRLRGRASEAFLRAAPLDSFSVFHFATHALVDETAVTRTALALSPGEGHDGFVGPGDLAGLPLNADLVVLSACRTAGGELVEGEGIQGLTAPLLQAGARSVVATTWRIADATTGPFIEAFYRELAGGRTVSAALRETKLAALRRGAPAAEWAAFLVTGDPAARVALAIPAEPSPARFWLAAALLALAAAAYRLSRRKRPGSAVA